jgi:hypothetical protein
MRVGIAMQKPGLIGANVETRRRRLAQAHPGK